MKKFGIDISYWQGSFDLKAAKAEGVEFVIVKGGGGDDGLYVDSRFRRNYEAAKRLGLPVGVYWFSRATTVREAETEADYFYTNVLQGCQFELPVYMDVEHEAQLKLSKDALTAVVEAWCARLEAKGFWVGIYASWWTFSAHVNDSQLQRYAHWVAQWSEECSYKGNAGVFGMWQFGGERNAIRSTKICGQVVDQNYMYIDYPAKIKKAKKNGFGKETTVKQDETTTYTVQKDDTLWDIAEKHLGSGTRYKEIKQLNGLTSDLIYAGQKLKLPKK